MFVPMGAVLWQQRRGNKYTGASVLRKCASGGDLQECSRQASTRSVMAWYPAAFARVLCGVRCKALPQPQHRIEEAAAAALAAAYG